MIASELSRQMGLITSADKERIKDIFLRAGLPVHPPEGMAADVFLDFMQRDKKVMNGVLRLILLETIGKAFICSDAAVDKIFSAITFSFESP